MSQTVLRIVKSVIKNEYTSTNTYSRIVSMQVYIHWDAKEKISVFLVCWHQSHPDPPQTHKLWYVPILTNTQHSERRTARTDPGPVSARVSFPKIFLKLCLLTLRAVYAQVSIHLVSSQIFIVWGFDFSFNFWNMTLTLKSIMSIV